VGIASELVCASEHVASSKIVNTDLIRNLLFSRTARQRAKGALIRCALPLILEGNWNLEEFMAALIDAINVKRKTLFELENTPFYCLEAEVNTPTARGGQTLVRLKMRNLLTNAVFEKTFKASDKFKEPDLQSVPASYLYSDSDGSHFLDQETYETLTLTDEMVGNALDFLIEGALIQLRKYNGNPIGLQLPLFVELDVSYTEPGVRGDSSSGSVTKSARLETGLEIRVPLFIKEGEKVKVSTENREFAGRA
jgi:elongation factor P